MSILKRFFLISLTQPSVSYSTLKRTAKISSWISKIGLIKRWIMEYIQVCCTLQTLVICAKLVANQSNLKYYFYSPQISTLVVSVKQFDTWKWHMKQLLYAKMHDNNSNPQISWMQHCSFFPLWRVKSSFMCRFPLKSHATVT